MATTMKGIIGGGVTFSASPATEKVIPTGYLVNESNTDVDYITKTITIPNGVKVIVVFASCFTPDYNTDTITIKVSSTNSKYRTWFGNNDYYDVSTQGYVGVTPNKQYTVTASANTHEGRIYINRFYIMYSPEINNKTPTITDY